MPDPGKQVVTARTESHSDVATSDAAKAYQVGQTERQFARSLLNRVREAKGEVRLRNFREEWVSTEDGLVHQMSIEVEPVVE
ncbi:MAG TPA: hypothetical protein VFU47_01935 [Armatimonadota bacterium]|nr:hypothetical protein [Armatimonadota bacterium]